MEAGKSLALGVAGGAGVVGFGKLMEALNQRVAAGEPVTLNPEVLALLAGMADSMYEVGRGVAANAAGIGALLTAYGQPLPTRRVEQIPYSITLNPAGLAGSGARLVEYAPKPGYIKWIMMHFPPGAAAWVNVAAGHGLTQLSPREGFLALDDTTQIFYFNEYVVDHEEIWVVMDNGDGINPHTITVTVGFEMEA